MLNDEIVEEIHRVRAEYAAKFDYDIDRMYEDIRKRQAASGRKFVSFPPRKPAVNHTRKPVAEKA